MEENMPRPSAMKQPSRIPAFSSSLHGSGLHEISDSQNNARAQYTATGHVGGQKRSAPAPGAGYSFLLSGKRTRAHGGNVVSGPEPKRKPLPAGSQYGSKSASTAMGNTKTIKPSSLIDLHRPPTSNAAGFRQLSNSSYTSNSSYGSSVGYGARPPSRSHTRTRSATRTVRPATSMGTREDGRGSNGTVPQQPEPFTVASPSTSKKPGKKYGPSLRKHKSAQVLLSSKSSCLPGERDREASLVRKFDHMTLNTSNQQQLEDQANPKLDASSASYNMPPPMTPRKGEKRSSNVPRYTNEAPRHSQVAPETPRQLCDSIQHALKSLTPACAPSPSPTKGSFLTKSSNVRNFLVGEVNDIDERVAKMGSEVERLRDFMESTEKISTSVKEELESSKRRVNALEDEKIELQAERARLKDQLQDAERQARRLQYDIEEQQSKYERQQKILEEDRQREIERLTEEFKRELGKNEKLQQEIENRCGAEAEARLESLSQDNKELRSTLERQKRDHEHEVRLLHEAMQRRDSDVRRIEDELRKANSERFDLQTHIRGNNETIERLRKRAEDAEERLSKDKGHLGGQISLLSSTLDLKSERIQTLEEHAKKLQAECEVEVQNIKLAAEKKIAEETALLRERLVKEEDKRHKLFEQVQELKGNIRVMCRIKPPSNPATDALIPFQPQWNEIDEERIDGLSIPSFREDLTNPGKMVLAKQRDFNFERVFDEKCSNTDVFDEISQLVQSVMDGKKVCIFCYGQTGSGKTFTMSKRQGDGDDGVIPRTQGMIFSEMERLKTLGWEYTVEGSYLEVYQDKLYDLLASRHSKPEPLTVDPIGDELKIKGHDFTLLNDARDLDEMIKVADNNRHVAATVKNDRSSRSHSILVLKIHGEKKDENGNVIKTRKGTLNLIDLAGSEKPDKNGPDQVYKEGVEINSSLSYLRTVLSNLGQGKTEGVDFRSYTLTQLLRPSLGKGCRTLMFVMVSPLKENENETIRSLEFARDAQKVKMGGNGAARSKK
ncbi:P-loop containing nucleoside triphosphate hydrolase protein [Xylaria venustula]|nr:P-loop containing nucleoside triphosphate hydrolase protein [Xylaria venustula]